MRDLRDGSVTAIPWSVTTGEAMPVQIWGDVVQVIAAAPTQNQWFSKRLGLSCTLVYMPDHSTRPTDPAYARAFTSLSDAFPYLFISHASLADLNTRLTPLPMDRFRPNLVVYGGTPYQEDSWRGVRVGTCLFELVKPCARCAITTIDQHTGQRSAEPLATLAGYRRRMADKSVKVDFGMNAVATSGGTVRVGDPVVPRGAIRSPDAAHSWPAP